LLLRRLLGVRLPRRRRAQRAGGGARAGRERRLGAASARGGGVTQASALYTGWVRHRRRSPAYAFRYRVCQLYLDLAELGAVLRDSRLWSVDRPNVVWFRRADHLGDPRVPLDVAVRDLVQERTG